MAASNRESKKHSDGLTHATFGNEILRTRNFICVLLAISTLASYWSVATCDYVNYDDCDYVTANPHVQSGLKWENVVWAFHTGHASNWHPLTWLSHIFDWQFFGNNP